MRQRYHGINSAFRLKHLFPQWYNDGASSPKIVGVLFFLLYKQFSFYTQVPRPWDRSSGETLDLGFLTANQFLGEVSNGAPQVTTLRLKHIIMLHASIDYLRSMLRWNSDGLGPRRVKERRHSRKTFQSHPMVGLQHKVPELFTWGTQYLARKNDFEGIRSDDPTKLLCLSPKLSIYNVLVKLLHLSAVPHMRNSIAPTDFLAQSYNCNPYRGMTLFAKKRWYTLIALS